MCRHLLTLDVVLTTILILVAHSKTLATKEKATVTMITIVRGIWFAETTIVFTTWDFQGGVIVVLSQPKLKVIAITMTVLVLVVPKTTLATKVKETATTTMTASVIYFADMTIVMTPWDFHRGVIAVKKVSVYMKSLNKN